ncbi:MAG: HTH domain-containing protein [Bacteroidota bacterium]
MSIIRKLKRIERMHHLIRRKSTGTPDAFARKLGCSKSMVYKLISELKDMGAPIVYHKYRESFIYTYPVDFKAGFFIKKNEETQ